MTFVSAIFRHRPGAFSPLVAMRFCVVAAFGPLAAAAQEGSAAPIGGELKLWHKLTFDFTGPETAESATPNPFTDYRLDVVFTHLASGKTYVVPGYYAADGHAAQTSASSGNHWRAHFAPGEVGTWTYTASFRTGPLLAVSEDPAAGTSAGFFDGQTGTFQIGPTDKTGRDFRAKGRLEYVGKHHLRFAGTGKYFMKAGVDSPENLLAYADFDGDFKTDGKDDSKIKTWSPHIADWREGDPEWQGGKGRGLIGALNYLADEGLNAVSFLTMNINGDDKNVFPYTAYGERFRLDVSRLDQWEIVFGHGTRKGLYLHFKTQETENELLLDGGDLGNQRKLYYRELIARFSHHLALNWNLGEEINDASLAQKVEWARFFHDHDPYGHHIVIHNGDQHFDLMGNASKVTGMSKQMNEADFSDTFFDVKRWLKNSAAAGKPWVVACDEPGNSSASLRPDSNPGTSHLDARRDALWATIMAGGAGIEFYFGSAYPHSDMTCQDFRSRDSFWPYCRHAIWLFEHHPFPFELLSNQHDLVSGTGTEQTDSPGEGGNRCLARIGDTYLVHLRSGGNHTLDLSGGTGSFTVKWFNPRSGGPLIPAADVMAGGVVSLGSPPDSPSEDWIVLVESAAGGSGTNAPPVANAGPDQSAFLAGPSAEVILAGHVTDDGLPDEFSLVRGWTKVSGPGEVSFSNPAASATVATFSATGSYVLRLSASDSDLSAFDEVVIQILPPETTGFRTFSAVEDASTVTGTHDNGPLLFVGSGDRVSYLKFDLSGLDAIPLDAVLRLTEAAGQASGPVNLSLYAAESNDWTEAGIHDDHVPSKGALLATFEGIVQAGQEVTFDLSEHLAEPGIYSVILEAAPQDGIVGFASRENPVAAGRPRLDLTVSGNSPPVFTAPPLVTQVNQAVTVPYSELLADASDPDGDPVSFVLIPGGTGSGGFVTMGSESLTYTPSIDYAGPDSFQLTVQDGRGTFTPSVLAIQVISPVEQAFSRTPTLGREGDDDVRIRFEGIPGFDHLIQRSTDLQAWTTLATVNGGTSGEVDHLDTEPPAGTVFYRIATP
jgi:hypothetical protein